MLYESVIVINTQDFHEFKLFSFWFYLLNKAMFLNFLWYIPFIQVIAYP